VRGRGPEAVLSLLRGIPLAQLEFDLLRVRGLDAERHAQVGTDPGILRTANVAGRGDGVGGLRPLGLIGGGGQEKGQQAGEPHAVHQWTSRAGGIGTSLRNAASTPGAAFRSGSTAQTVLS